MFRRAIELCDHNATRFPQERLNDVDKALNEFWLASALMKLGRQTEAEQLYRRTLRLNPKNRDMWNAEFTSLILGMAHYNLGEYAAAIEALEDSMRIRNGGDSLEWFFLAVASWKLGRKNEAMQWYEKAIKWMESNTPGYSQELRLVRTAAEKLLKPDGPRDNPSP
jgi:tetratricopeptide (TPR) repeat protein